MPQSQHDEPQRDTVRSPADVSRPDRHPARTWTLLTHHAQLLLAVAQRPDARVRDLAAVVGVTPRAALTLLQDLEDAGYLHRTRLGRRNRYTIHPDHPVHDAAASVRSVAQFVAAFAGNGPRQEPFSTGDTLRLDGRS